MFLAYCGGEMEKDGGDDQLGGVGLALRDVSRRAEGRCVRLKPQNTTWRSPNLQVC